MIKILFFIEKLAFNGFIGGAEKVLINLVNNMDPCKFDITVQTLYPEAYASLLNDNIKYKYCYRKKDKVKQFALRIEQVFGLVYPIHIKDNYDIECAYLECGSTKIIASSTNKKAKKLAWVHCDVSVAFDRNFAKKAANWYKKYDKVICVSQKVRDSFVDYFGDKPESVVLYNVVDSDQIIAKSKEPLSEGVVKEGLTLLCVGRLTPPKNPIRLLKVHKKLLESGIKHELWWVGDGDMRGEVEKAILNMGLTETVKLFGFQSNPYPFIREADICVCSSNYEGFSTFITESVILGKPIVTTDCSGMKEILGESEYGIVTRNSDEGLYIGLKNVLEDGGLRTEYAEKSKARGENFLSSVLIEANEVFFAKLLGENIL